MNEEKFRKIAHSILQKAKPHILEQVRTKLKAVFKADDSDDVDLSTFDEFSDAEFVGLLSVTAEQSGSKFLVDLGIPENDSMFNQVNTRAVEFAQARAGDLITEISDTTRDEIRELITNGLTEGMSYQEVSDKLEELYSFSPERADLIARTENAIAGNQGILSGMKELEKQGTKILKAWLPDAEACDACLDLGEEDPIPLDQDFDGGDYDDTDAPPLHPNCRCTIISEIQDDNEDDE